MAIHKGHGIHKGCCISKRPLQLPVNLTVAAVQDQLLIECNITNVGGRLVFFSNCFFFSPFSEFKDNIIKFLIRWPWSYCDPEELFSPRSLESSADCSISLPYQSEPNSYLNN